MKKAALLVLGILIGLMIVFNLLINNLESNSAASMIEDTATKDLRSTNNPSIFLLEKN